MTDWPLAARVRLAGDLVTYRVVCRALDASGMYMVRPEHGGRVRRVHARLLRPAHTTTTPREDTPA